MSVTLEEKLAQPVSVGGRARATLEQLEKRRGFWRVAEREAVVDSMGDVERWARVSGNGKQSLWELQP